MRPRRHPPSIILTLSTRVILALLLLFATTSNARAQSPSPSPSADICLNTANAHTDAPPTRTVHSPPPTTPDHGLGTLLLRSLLALGVVCALALVALKLGRHVLDRSDHTRPLIKLTARQSLSAKREILVARVGTRHLVIGSTDHRLSLLAELTPAEALGPLPAPDHPDA